MTRRNRRVVKMKQIKRGSMENADRISNLPDVIIHEIFSFLDAKDVVKTSVLAKRWRYLWTTTPNIYLDDDLFPSNEEDSPFVLFVDTLHRLYNAPKISTYVLVIRQPCNSMFTEGWVNFAIEHNVDILHVDVANFCWPIEMPSCNSVRDIILELGGGDLLLPSPARFAMLESLSLTNVRLTAALHLNSDHCPILKNLNLDNCSGLMHLTVDCPKLVHLRVTNCYQLDQLVVCGPKLQTFALVESFREGSSTSLANISAPILQELTWADYFFDKCSLGMFECLRLASVCLVLGYNEETKGPYFKNALKFFQQLTSAETLTVQLSCFTGLSANLELLEVLPTSIHNIHKLSLLVGHDDEYSLRGISCVLPCLSNLQTLSIHTVTNPPEEQPSARFLNADHTGALNNLKEVDYCGFSGEPYEMDFAKNLLENAVILRKMIVVLAGELLDCQKKKTRVVQKLLNFKTASSDATICFQDHCS
ncbi:F-box/FBD/LRR-repeat protein isoform X3 [Canna indica]|uniref:F-box/FBD/LRR-repeat protein isoform X3 n=1 Tax=Canna indica TaxID=4628 RepID=A0AAQ3Q328_9LILI|nr:F-box/FBD/LRR-repeat protein isoform X3 [Canna indica]